MQKQSKRNALVGLVALTLGLMTLSPTAFAEDAWPSRPIRLLVAGPAGGTADSLARLLAEGMHKKLGQPVIVESKPGASGSIAIRDLVNNGKDGYTFLVIQNGAVTEVPLAYKVNYDPFKDIKPLAQLVRTALVLVANKDLHLKTLDDVIKYGQAQKDGMYFASYATGMRGHTSGMLLGQLAHLNMQYVGYKGSPKALVDLMGGQFPIMFDGVTTSLPLIKGGKIDAVAVSYPTRIHELPDVPTFKELGYPELSKPGWFGVWSRPDTPDDIQKRVRDVALSYFAEPEVLKSIRSIGMEPGSPDTTEALTAEMHTAYDQQAALLKSIHYVQN